MDQIDPSASLRVPEEILFREIDGEAILLNTDSGLYFGLDEVGSTIWTALRESGSVEGAIPRLLEVFDTDAETLRADLLEFVTELVENALLTTDSSN